MVVSVDASAARAAARDSLSCVVPCFNEAESLPQLLAALTEQLQALGLAWEIIVVDDGSRDDSAAWLRAQAERQPGLRVIELSRNFGKEAALSAGLAAARGAAVVQLDADLQHAPTMIATFVDHWQRGADMVYAVRAHRRDESRLKRWGVRAFYRSVNAFHRFDMPEGAGDFRLMDRSVVDVLLALPERGRFMKGLYAWAGFDTVAVPYSPAPRACGHSRFNLWRLAALAADGVTGFTTWPLRVASVLGVVVALAGLGYGVWLSVSYLLWGHPLSGWTTIVVGLAIFSGLQMLLLGLLGEYVGRIFEEVKGRPVYVVKRTQGRGLEPSAPAEARLQALAQAAGPAAEPPALPVDVAKEGQ